MEAEPDSQTTLCPTNFRHICRIETEEVAGARVAVEHHAEEETCVFPIALSIRHKDGLTWRVVRHAPDLGLLRLDVNLGQAIIERGLPGLAGMEG